MFTWFEFLTKVAADALARLVSDKVPLMWLGGGALSLVAMTMAYRAMRAKINYSQKQARDAEEQARHAEERAHQAEKQADDAEKKVDLALTLAEVRGIPINNLSGNADVLRYHLELEAERVSLALTQYTGAKVGACFKVLTTQDDNSQIVRSIARYPDGDAPREHPLEQNPLLKQLVEGGATTLSIRRLSAEDNGGVRRSAGLNRFGKMTESIELRLLPLSTQPEDHFAGILWIDSDIADAFKSKRLRSIITRFSRDLAPLVEAYIVACHLEAFTRKRARRAASNR